MRLHQTQQHLYSKETINKMKKITLNGKTYSPIIHLIMINIKIYKKLIYKAQHQKQFNLKNDSLALAGVAQWVECQLLNQRVTGSIPSQGTCLGFRPDTQLGACEKQPHIGVSLPL